MKKNILWFILGGIIFSTITATAAYVYTARDIGYQPSDENWNVTNANDALTSLKDDLNTITNKVEGIERVYKAGEVELVALVSDDSFYKDSNDKYVLSNSDTGRTLLADTSTYKSLASTEDCLGIFDVDTVIPFSNNADFIQIIDSETNSYTITQNDVNTYKQLIIIGQSSTGGNGSISMSATNVSNSFSSYNSHTQGTSGVGVFIRNNLVAGDIITVNKGNGMYLKLMVLGVKY